MKPYKALIMAAAIMLVGGMSLGASAKVKCVPKVYAFGFAASFNDSIVYFTDIQEIDSAWINEKNKFLIGRDNYSYQLKNYFAGIGLPHRTCIISFALNRKDIEKKYKKMKEKYTKSENFLIKSIDGNEFCFTAIKPDDFDMNSEK